MGLLCVVGFGLFFLLRHLILVRFDCLFALICLVSFWFRVVDFLDSCFVLVVCLISVQIVVFGFDFDLRFTTVCWFGVL